VSDNDDGFLPDPLTIIVFAMLIMLVAAVVAGMFLLVSGWVGLL
jgi:hypothetical protein